MNLDTYNEHNPKNPINETEREPLTELEMSEEWNMELCAKIAKMRKDLRTLKGIEESYKTFGFLTENEQTEKINILKNY